MHILTLSLPPPIYEQFKAIQQRTSAPDFPTIVQRALALYDFATEIESEGCTIKVQTQDGTMEPLRILPATDKS